MKPIEAAQLVVGRLIHEGAGAVGGMVHHIGLHQRQLHFPLMQRLQVSKGAGGALHRAVQAMAGRLFIEQPANGATGRVVDAVERPSTDGEIGRRGCLQGQRQGRRQPWQGAAKQSRQRVQGWLGHSEPDQWLIKGWGWPIPVGIRRASCWWRHCTVLGAIDIPGCGAVAACRQNIPYCDRIRIWLTSIYCGAGCCRPYGEAMGRKRVISAPEWPSPCGPAPRRGELGCSRS